MIINYNKIMCDILKDFNKGKKCKTKWMFDTTDDTYIYIAIDGYYILCVPRCLWILDTEKIINQGVCSDHNHCFTNVNITSMIKNTNMMDTVTYNFTCTTSIDKKKVAVFSPEEGDRGDVWINENLLKYLNIDLYNVDNNILFSGSGKKSPLIIHEDNYFIGMLLPINHN